MVQLNIKSGVKTSLSGKSPEYLLKKCINGTDRKTGIVVQNIKQYLSGFLSYAIFILPCFLNNSWQVIRFFSVCKVIKLIQDPVFHLSSCPVCKCYCKYPAVIILRPEQAGEVNTCQFMCFSRSGRCAVYGQCSGSHDGIKLAFLSIFAR